MKNNETLNTKNSTLLRIQVSKLTKANESLGNTVIRLENENQVLQQEKDECLKLKKQSDRAKGIVDRKFTKAVETIDQQVGEINRLNVVLNEAENDRNKYKKAYEDMYGRYSRLQSNIVIQEDMVTKECFVTCINEKQRIINKLQQELMLEKAKNGELQAKNCRLACRVSTDSDIASAQLTKLSNELDRCYAQISNLIKALDHYDAKLDEDGNLVKGESIWDKDILLTEMKNPNKNSRDKLKVRLVHSDYGYFVDARIFRDNEPTRRGLCLSPTKMMDFTGTLEYALEKAVEVMENEE